MWFAKTTQPLRLKCLRRISTDSQDRGSHSLVAVIQLIPSLVRLLQRSTNRLTHTFQGVLLPGDAYDAGGNLTNDPHVGKMAYDGENHQTSFDATGDGAPEATYEYDGHGNRVKKIEGAATTVFVYDAFGNLAAEYATAPDANLSARRSTEPSII